MIAYIAHVGCTKKGVAHRMDKHICITMTKQPFEMVYLYASYDKVTTLYKLMNIKAKPNTNLHTN